MSAYGPLLDALRGVRWPARRAVGAAPPGTHRSSQKGTSGEFTEYRLYRQGDDPRALDWRLLARSDRAFVRLSDDRALLATWLLLDGSASMDYPRGDVHTNKWRFARAVAVGLAAVAHGSADPVGLLVSHAQGVTRVPPRTRRGTVQELARVVDAVRCGGTGELAPLLTTMPPRGRVVLVSDLLGDADAQLRAAAALVVTGAMVEVVHVVAPEELDVPDGVHRTVDPEHDVRDGAREMRRVLDAKGRATYRAAFDEFRRSMAQRWRAIGAGYTEASSGVEPSRVVRAVALGAGAHAGAR